MAKPIAEIKQFAGAMNLDDPNEDIGKGFHRDARNMRFRGTMPNMRGEIMAGNIVVTNSLLPTSGTNVTIGRYYDAVKKRIIFFNYNSLGSHGIYLFNTIPQTFQRLVEVGINTDGDVLGFDANVIIYNIDLIYGDSTQGDIIYWINSQYECCKINIDTALAGGYGTIIRSFLDVAKEPADIPPYVVYESDPSNTINNLRKKIFRVKVRWVFDDNEKSVTSSQSAMPIPFNAFDQDFSTNPTNNCRLAITYQTGPKNVTKIEILVSNSEGNVMSDYYLVASIDKSVNGLSDNDIATYLFYNDKGYTNINLNESIQLFDYVPQNARAQALLNGNVLSYANITEGYPNLTNFSDGTNTSSITSSQVVYYYGNSSGNLIANQSGKSAFGSGAIHIVIRGLVISPSFMLDTYTVRMTDSSNISYTLNIGDDAAAAIEGLRQNAISKGYTILFNGANDLIVVKTGIQLAGTSITSNYTGYSVLNMAFPAYDWMSKYGFGLVYFDKKGRTNGVVYTNGFSIQTPSYTENNPPNDIPILSASIYHQPPDWAYYYQWVRTKNLTKQTYVQWVTDRTYKDTLGVAGLIKYVYLSIESLNAFVRNNPGSPLGYSFTAGDRVRFFKRFNTDGTTAILYGNTKDFEIIGSVTDPTINGEVKSGQFVKIILPSTDGSFDFGLTGYDNYFIELYTPAQPVANNLNLYYEFGQRYQIGNPTLSNRFHQGQNQNQDIVGGIPATFQFTAGDHWIKLRAIQTGNVYTWNIPTTNANGFRFLVPLNFQGSTYNDSNITSHSVAYAGVGNAFNPTTDNRWFQAAVTAASFKIGGSFSVTFPTARSGDSWRLRIQNRFGEDAVVVLPFDASAAGTYAFPLTLFYNGDGTTTDTITLEDDHIFLLFECVNNNSDRQCTFLATNLTLTIDHVINQRCIDPNFSDYYPSSVNSNGRAFVYDENANKITYPVMIRWGGVYQSDTSINNTNRFYPENMTEAKRSYGAIMRLVAWDGLLRIGLERKWGHTGIYGKFITDSNGNNALTTTDSIITDNNIQYYNGDYGVGNQPDGVISSGFRIYFPDPIKAVLCRLSLDGIEVISEKYKVQTWAGGILPQYLNPGTYTYGGKQRVTGAYNVRKDNTEEVFFMAQGTDITPGESISFNESNNCFQSKYDIDCDYMVCAENVLYFFRNGKLYIRTDSNSYGIFFGVQYPASITLVFNDNETIKKNFMAIAYQSNQTWSAEGLGDIETNTINSQTIVKQQSLIMQQDFDVLENPNRYAAFNRDYNSMSDPAIALWEGDYLTGNLIICKLSITYNGSCYLYSPYITYSVNPRNL